MANSTIMYGLKFFINNNNYAHKARLLPLHFSLAYTLP